MKKISKGKRTSLIVICAIGLIIGSVSYAIFSKGEYKRYTEQKSGNVFSKLKNIDKKNQSIELSEGDVDEILEFALCGGVRKGDVDINKTWVHIQGDKIGVYALVNYKSAQVVLSTIGSLEYNDKITYIPDGFKVGKVSIPKNLVLNNIKKILKDKVDVEGNNIVINKKDMPVELNSVVLKDNKLTINVKESLTNQILNKVHKELSALSNGMNDKALLEKINKAKSNVESMKKDLEVNVDNNVANADNKSNSNNDNKTSKSSNKVSKKHVDVTGSLSTAAGQLSAARGAVSSSKEGQIVDIMLSTVNTLSSNPKYNYSGEVGEAMSIYRTLSPEQKKNFKVAFFSNVDVANGMKLRSMFGI